jgi:hypothetical protein
MVEGEKTCYLVMFETNGLHHAPEILENYDINSETDVSILDRDDFCKMGSRGLKSLEAKKLERWCDADVTLCVHVPRTCCR